MTAQPVAALHVLGRPGKQQLAEAQAGDKDPGFADLAGLELDPLDRIAGVIDFDALAGRELARRDRRLPVLRELAVKLLPEVRVRGQVLGLLLPQELQRMPQPQIVDDRRPVQLRHPQRIGPRLRRIGRAAPRRASPAPCAASSPARARSPAGRGPRPAAARSPRIDPPSCSAPCRRPLRGCPRRLRQQPPVPTTKAQHDTAIDRSKIDRAGSHKSGDRWRPLARLPRKSHLHTYSRHRRPLLLGSAPKTGAAGGPQLRKSGGPELRKSGGTHPRKSGGSDQRKFCIRLLTRL